MTQIVLKRVYEDYDGSDGYRVLVDRLWPRGVKKEHLHYDLWAKDITPSPTIREWFHQDPDYRWEEFKTKYTLELSHSESMKAFLDEINKHKKVTLLYAAKSPDHNHALILKKFIQKHLK